MDVSIAPLRIAFVVAGAGSMFCGACARDALLARGLQSAGHEIAVFPIYTPLILDENLDSLLEPLQIGGINAFLRDRFPNLRLPSLARDCLENPGLIAWAARFAVRTQARDLGQMTVSFLRGTAGLHRGAVNELADAVALFEPDCVVLANSLLSGLIEPLGAATGSPIVCQVQGEDGFLDELPEPWLAASTELLRSQARLASHFAAPCAAHAEDMSVRLNQAGERFAIIPPSVRSVGCPRTERTAEVVRLGHLSSIRRAKGLDLLLKAAIDLRDPSIEIAIRGKVLEPDFDAKLQKLTLECRAPVKFGGEVSSADKRSFLEGCDFMVLPSRLRESRGIAALESLAAGTPVIAPARGIFPELAEVTGGVALYPTDELLSDTIRDCIVRREDWRERGVLAAEKVADHYSPARSASEAERLLAALTSRQVQ